MADLEDKLQGMDINEEEVDLSEFDPSTMKKKKKKSKKTEGAAPVEEPTEDQEAAPAAAAADDAEIDPLAMFGEKKKKKKKVKIEDDAAAAEGAEEAPAADAGESLDFGDMKKKKKKSKKVDFSAFEDEQDQGGEDGARDPDDIFAAEDEEGGSARASGASGAGDSEESWIGTNRDYTYVELLSRVFKILRQNNPELAGEKKRYTIVPPSVMRDGNKKTVFANVADICKRMHRQPEHVIQFLFAELGTSGSIDGSQRLVIKGRFQQKQIEAVLRRYIVEYVTCKTCKSPDTLLTKENRLFFLGCESCGSTRSVSAIKSGFQAQTGKRAAQRA
ncbi:MAG: domain found in IF2B/IF5-domain-containing protein [Benniella sp.]|nr:MAG: domain found in IF2B/IF5-domain-containing protein [Benniella sp.]